MSNYPLTLVSCFLLVSASANAAQPTASHAELVEARKIWDAAPHNAFTDLVRAHGKWFCTFREGQAHVSTEASIRIISSVDGGKWAPAAVIHKAGYDLRDPKITTAPDGRLMLVGGATVREGTKPATESQSFVCFSEDGRRWSSPEWAGPTNYWLWRVSWHKKWAYGVAYDVAPPTRDAKRYKTTLLLSEDGASFVPLISNFNNNSGPTEATLRWGKNETAYCLQRRDGKESNTALLGSANAPYTDWDWKDLGSFFGGPNFLQLPDGRWVAVGRLVQDKKAKTVVCELDVNKGALVPLLTLPSGGDCSYPGLAWDGGLLWISYYSSHEGKTSIYLAKVRFD